MNYNYAAGPVRSHFCKPGHLSGRKVDKYGYVHVRRPDYWRADSGGYVLEHISVWEDAHNQHLPDGWIIRHINGINGDNRLENLLPRPRGKCQKIVPELSIGGDELRNAQIGSKTQWTTVGVDEYTKELINKAITQGEANSANEVIARALCMLLGEEYKTSTDRKLIGSLESSTRIIRESYTQKQQE